MSLIELILMYRPHHQANDRDIQLHEVIDTLVYSRNCIQLSGYSNDIDWKGQNY